MNLGCPPDQFGTNMPIRSPTSTTICLFQSIQNPTGRSTSFHSGDIRLNNGEGANLIDLQPIVADICEVECDRGTVKVAIQTGNAGLRDASGQLDVKFYTEIDGVLNEVITVSEEVLIRSGTSLGGAQYTFDMASLTESNLIISVDDNGVEGGVFEECDEENNQIRIDDLCVEDD